jgi:hypothetical protein
MDGRPVIFQYLRSDNMSSSQKDVGRQRSPVSLGECFFGLFL